MRQIWIFGSSLLRSHFTRKILRCISQLELAQLIGTGVKPRYLSSGQANHNEGGGLLIDPAECIYLEYNILFIVIELFGGFSDSSWLAYGPEKNCKFTRIHGGN